MHALDGPLKDTVIFLQGEGWTLPRIIQSVCEAWANQIDWDHISDNAKLVYTAISLKAGGQGCAYRPDIFRMTGLEYKVIQAALIELKNKKLIQKHHQLPGYKISDS